MDTLSRLKKFDNLLSLDKSTLQLIGDCYGQFVEACIGSAGSNVITSNLSTYNVIMEPDVMDLITLAYLGGQLNSCISSYPKLAQALDTRSENYIQRLVIANGMVHPISVESINDIITAVKSFGIAEATQGDFDEGGRIDDPELMAAIFGGDDSLGDIEEEDLNFLLNGEESDSDSDEDLGENEGISFDIEEDSEEIGVMGPEEPRPNPTQTPPDIDNTDDFSDNFDEQVKDIKSTWSGSLDPIIAGIMASYDALYRSCYGLVAPAGVLTDKGIIRTKSDGTRQITGNRVLDISVFMAVAEAIPGLFDCYASETDEPSVAQVSSSKHPITYVNMHLKFMFGHLNYCKGRKFGLRHYLTEHNIKNDSDTKIIKYADIRGWIQETIERYFYQAYLDAGITDDITPASMETVNNINQMMARSLRNIIAVVERKDKVNTRIRICTDTKLNVSAIASFLTKKLNIGSSNNIVVRQIGEYENGVADLNIIYNDKAYSQSSLFAHQVLDILEAQGIKPSWDNVILGKKDDGTIMTYNFKNVQTPTYALYAGSRSGKGVMTLNLLASALADNCKIAYVDGKPEMANVLADIAWKSGLDAFAFNGFEVNKSEGLEVRGNCIRKVDRFMSADKLPENIFLTDNERTQFMLVVHYLRCMELVIKMAEARFDKCPSSDWIVSVFDECEQFASREAEVNQLLNDAYDRRKKAIDPNDPKGTKKVNITTDPAAVFIENYRTWRRRIESDFLACVTSAFGKGNMTVFFVWQNSTFPEKYKGKSSLANMILSARGKLVRIIGKGGVVQGGSSDFGNAMTKKDMPWYDGRFDPKSPGGYFAIGSSITGDMTIFRPFNVFSNADHKDWIIRDAKSAGLTEQDLYGGSLNPDGTVIKESGFEGYADKLLSRFNLSTAQQLNLGYTYADELVRQEGLGQGLCSFVYDAHSFGGGTTESGELSGGYDIDADALGFDDGPAIDFGEYDSTPIDQGIQSQEENTEESLPGNEYQSGIKPSAPERAMSAEDMEILRRAQELKRRAQAQPQPQPRPEVDTEVSGGVTPPTWGTQAPIQWPSNEPDTNEPPLNLEDEQPESGYTWPTEEEQAEPIGPIGQSQGGPSQGGPVGPGGQSGFGGYGSDFEGRYADPLQAERAERRRIEYADRAGPEVTTPNPESAYSFGDARTGFCTFLSPSAISAVMGLNRENSVLVTVKDHRSPMMSNRLLKTLRGSRYELESRWKTILNSIAREQNPGTITKVTICNDIMIFNNRQVAAVGLLGGPDGVEVVDIVNFTQLSKKFPNIRELKIDRLVFGAATNEFPADTILNIFRMLKSLGRLSIWEPGYGVQPELFLRRDVIQGNSSQKMQQAQAEEEFGKKLDILSAANNPRFGRESFIEKHRIIEGSKNLTGAGWEKCKQSFSRDKYVGGLFLGAFTVGAAAITGTLMGIGKLSSMLRGKR